MVLAQQLIRTALIQNASYMQLGFIITGWKIWSVLRLLSTFIAGLCHLNYSFSSHPYSPNQINYRQSAFTSTYKSVFMTILLDKMPLHQKISLTSILFTTPFTCHCLWLLKLNHLTPAGPFQIIHYSRVIFFSHSGYSSFSTWSILEYCT